MNRQVKCRQLISEINITPFTDVILVLLIIFMIATPFIYQSSTKVELPRVSASTSHETSKDAVVVINARGEVFLDDAKVDLDSLKLKLQRKVREKPGLSVIVNGDKNVRYDSVMAVLDILNQLGIKTAGLGIELKKGSSPN